jgi:hypothetical protein
MDRRLPGLRATAGRRDGLLEHRYRLPAGKAALHPPIASACVPLNYNES